MISVEKLYPVIVMSVPPYTDPYLGEKSVTFPIASNVTDDESKEPYEDDTTTTL